MEARDYEKYTKPAELHKAVNTLKGLIAGITADREASEKEFQELIHWCSVHQRLRDRHPFSELLPLVERAYADMHISEEEAKDILWLCNNFMSDSSYYNVVTSSIQFLSGLLHGIMADGDLSDGEIHTLSEWIEFNSFLKGCYPFDEIESLLCIVLRDGKVDQDERQMLMSFFSNFIDMRASYNLSESNFEALRDQYSVDGICAVTPEISFYGKVFCFTGQSYRTTRDDIESIILTFGGQFKKTVTKKTDYLVVGNAGNPCWAYACYGRKIEEAVELRKEGAKILIVNETDFWDAIAE